MKATGEAKSKDTKITQATLKSLKPTGKEFAVWCAGLPGFGVRIRPTGAMSYCVIYKIGGKRAPFRRVTLGDVRKLPLERARAEAELVLADATRGIDRAAEKAAKKAELTVAEVCDRYLAVGTVDKKASTLVSDRSRIARHIKPLLGRKRIGDLSNTDIKKFLHDVEAGKTAIDERAKETGRRSIVRGGRGAAVRTVRLLGGILSWAVEAGIIRDNPRRGVKLKGDRKSERFLSGEELQRLGDTLRLAETEGLPWRENDGRMAKHRPRDPAKAREVMSPHVAAAIRLLMFTGCRAGEILKLRWREVDFERGVLNLPDSKTGQKKVLLAAPALKVLVDLPRVGEFVIAGADPAKPRRDIKNPWSKIIAHAGLDGLRLHDLRHSFASVGAASGMGLPIVGKLLGHASPATTARYAHLADDPVRRAGESIAAQIAARLDGTGDGAEIVPIRRGQ